MDKIIIAILWLLSSAVTATEYASFCRDLSKTDKIILFFLFIISGPIMIISSMLSTLFNSILPEGWDDDDDPKKL